MKWAITSEQAGMMIREFLREIGGFSRRILIAAKSDTGEILLNGEAVTVRKKLEEGDVLEVTLPPKQVSKWLYPEKLDLTIVYEDESVLVLNKEPGIPTLPSPKHPSKTIANGVLAHYKTIGNPNTIHVVTRLDKDTSGLLLIAKNRMSHSKLARSQKEFGIKRKYQAIVEGNVGKEKGEINAPIGRKPGSIIEREVREDGKPARSYYQVMKQVFGHTLVEVALETGRTHQIRVHFSSIGHPLLGDDLYGGKRDDLNRQALHCHELIFPHPLTGERLVFQIDLPNDMKQIIQQLKVR